MEGLGRLNSSRSENLSLVSSIGTPLYPTGGGRKKSGRRIHLAQRRLPRLALGLRCRGMGLRITAGSVRHRREAAMITVSTERNCRIFY